MRYFYTEHIINGIKRPKHAREYILLYDAEYLESLKKMAGEDYQAVLFDDNYSWIDIKLTLLNYEWLDFLSCYMLLINEKSKKKQNELLKEYLKPAVKHVKDYYYKNKYEHFLWRFKSQMENNSIKEFMYGRFGWDDDYLRWGREDMWDPISVFKDDWENMKMERKEWCLKMTHEIRRGVYLYLAIKEGIALDTDWKKWKQEKE